MHGPIDETTIDEPTYRATCPVCEQEIWAGMNPAPNAVFDDHVCPGPPQKSSAVKKAETVTSESEAGLAEVAEQARPGAAPAEPAPPLG